MAADPHRALVDPETLAFLDLVPAVTVGPDTLAAVRADAAVALPEPLPVRAVDQTRVAAPGRDGAADVPVTLLRPTDAAKPYGAILHIHGGGYVAGAAAAMAPRNARLAAELGCLVASVDYRLAPETPFPGPLHDCAAALYWLFARGPELGVDPARIGVMGESAGGGLAAALAILARDEDRHRLAFQHLVYPMLDDRTVVDPAPHPAAGRHVWTPASNRFGWASLLGTEPGGADVSPLAAPSRCVDLGGLPPTFLLTGALDLFVDEDLDYARRLARAGVPVELVLYAGAVHGFDLLPGTLLARRAWDDRIAALARALTFQIG